MKVPPALVDLFLEHTRFLITTHIRPDGDAVGSELALARTLERLGKEVVIQNESPVPENFSFLPGAEGIGLYGELPFAPEVAVILDAPEPFRAGNIQGHLPAIEKVANIDHHISNRHYGRVSWVEPGSSSVGEMIYHLLPALGLELDRPTALCVYVAILTDMGKFQYMVTPESGVRIFRLAARLVETGLVPYEIYKKVYNLYSAAPLELLGEVLSTLKFAAGEQIAYLQVDREMRLRYNDDSYVTDSLVSYPRDIASTRVALLFTEMDDGVKVSLRSKEPDLIDVNRIAGEFGGGGHPAAAGATLEGPLAEAVARVLSAVEKRLAQLPPLTAAEFS